MIMLLFTGAMFVRQEILEYTNGTEESIKLYHTEQGTIGSITIKDTVIEYENIPCINPISGKPNTWEQ